MNDEALYQATVPVFRHYTARIDAIAARLDAAAAAKLADRLADGSFSAGEHLTVAQGFVLRTVYPVIGVPVPPLSDETPDQDGLRRRCVELRERLDGLSPADFRGAAARSVTHVAGEADHEQNATEFVTLYALPNFFFHLTMGYATLRRAGVSLGKADFDAHHAYPSGFRFV